ncbi:MAG: xanthine dehydrogenase family protein molybdopterin-binding subunit [Actinomycetota bacterium]
MTATEEHVQTSGLGFVGQSVKRVEDEWLLAGQGDFVADRLPEGVAHAAFLRSPFPHATIDSIDTSAAKKLPGVIAVYTGAEVNANTNPFIPLIMLPDMYTPLFMPMTEDKARFVGDPVAIVLAESRYIAEDALELIEVDYTDLEPVATMSQARNPNSPQLWDKADGNVLHDGSKVYGDVDAAFAKADHVFTETFSCHRVTNQPMEARGTVVEIGQDGHLTITSTSQAPHAVKWAVAAMTVTEKAGRNFRKFWRMKERRANFKAARKAFLKEHMPAIRSQDRSGQKHQNKRENPTKHQLKMAMGLLASEDFPTVRAGDIGGGFGSKGSVHREEMALIVASKMANRSAQWIEDRVENLLDGGQAREEEFTMSIAIDDDGTFRGLKCHFDLDYGAYPSFPIGGALTQGMIRVYMPGPYRFPVFEFTSRMMATNKGKQLPYRGPWANETWARERIIDIAAEKLGMDPLELRQKNMYAAEDFPTKMVTGPTLDVTMSCKGTLDRAVEEVRGLDLDAMRADAESRGKKLGVGLASYHEAAPGPPDFLDSVTPGNGMLANEEARAVIERDGSIKMYTSQSPHGQSHATTYAQVVADEFGVAMDDVEIVWGNTDTSRFSFIGTGGSRGGPIGGGVMKYSAREAREQVNELAAEMLEASVEDVTIENGNIHVAGVPARGISYADVAAEAAKRKGSADGPAFEVVRDYRGHGDGGWSVATHVAVVEVDMDTGQVDIPKYLVVEDCGPIINPKIVDGQVRGGVAQGIGMVLYENLVYSDEGNPQATTYMDYLIPTAMEIPEIDIIHLETHSPGENDFRGVGEGGMIGAPAALTSAVSDALGVQATDMYLPPTKILEMAGVIDPD